MGRRIRLARQLLVEHGFQEGLRQLGLRLLLRATDTLPLARVNQAGIFAHETSALREQELRQIRQSSLMHDASQVEVSYPHIFEAEGRFLRYAYLPAQGFSRGLVVMFHGHDAFLHMGPLRPWRQFDVLAPWDTFGHQRRGSWFWGERGDNITERMLAALIANYRKQQDLFTIGSSMGGFGALWHGIRQGARGIYCMCPQIDLSAKIVEYGEDDRNNPYGYLRGSAPGTEPDLLGLAMAQDELPPLMLIQNQFDHVNPFSEHGFRLIEIYNRKRAWYGLRIAPSIGHGGDGRPEEAELFFSLILDRKPERTLRQFNKNHID